MDECIYTYYKYFLNTTDTTTAYYTNVTVDQRYTVCAIYSQWPCSAVLTMHSVFNPTTLNR